MGMGGGATWLYQVPSTGCRCGLRFLSGLLINCAYVFVCVRVKCECAGWGARGGGGVVCTRGGEELRL